jgi:hypothetical protein
VSTSVDECRRVSTSVDECRRVSTSVDECRRVSTSVDECRRVSTSVGECRRVSTRVYACTRSVLVVFVLGPWLRFCQGMGTKDVLAGEAEPGVTGGIGYTYNETDLNPFIEVRSSPWLAARNASSSCGLFAGAGHRIKTGSLITTYSGKYVTIGEYSKYAGDKRYLRGVATFRNGRLCIDGFQTPQSGFGMAQFANDFRGSTLRPNAKLVNTDIGLGVQLRATKDIFPGDEILLNYGRRYFDDPPMFDHGGPDAVDTGGLARQLLACGPLVLSVVVCTCCVRMGVAVVCKRGNRVCRHTGTHRPLATDERVQRVR